jgi:hypothetical protein
MATKTIIDMAPKKKKVKRHDSNTGLPYHRQAHYQPRYYGRHDGMPFNKAYQVIVKKLENEIVYYKETVEC